MTAPLRVVLDTNVVLSALVFGGGPTARIRQGWQSGRVVPLASAATAQELVRVLAYPKFRLAPPEREELLADYLPWVEVVTVPDPPPAFRRCRDPDDWKFLQLAVAGAARVLVSGDRDLLVLRRVGRACQVMTVDAFIAAHLALEDEARTGV